MGPLVVAITASLCKQTVISGDEQQPGAQPIGKANVSLRMALIGSQILRRKERDRAVHRQNRTTATDDQALPVRLFQRQHSVGT